MRRVLRRVLGMVMLSAAAGCQVITGSFSVGSGADAGDACAQLAGCCPNLSRAQESVCEAAVLSRDLNACGQVAQEYCPTKEIMLPDGGADGALSDATTPSDTGVPPSLAGTTWNLTELQCDNYLVTSALYPAVVLSFDAYGSITETAKFNDCTWAYDYVSPAYAGSVDGGTLTVPATQSTCDTSTCASCPATGAITYTYAVSNSGSVLTVEAYSGETFCTDMNIGSGTFGNPAIYTFMRDQ